jgi:hypothetical protein
MLWNGLYTRSFEHVGALFYVGAAARLQEVRERWGCKFKWTCVKFFDSSI